jgi:hypothetical protein
MVAAALSAETMGLSTAGKVARLGRLTEADEAVAPGISSNQTSRMNYCPTVDC